MAEHSPRLLVGLLVVFLACLPGCASVGATASVGGVPAVVAENQVAARVQYQHRQGCADRTLDLLQVDDVYRRADAWAVDRKRAGYTDPSVDYQAPRVKYPKSELRPGTAEAILVMILIRSDGSVESSVPVCSTSQVFIRYAQETVQGNRYAPARMDGDAVRGVAFQTIVFSTYN